MRQESFFDLAVPVEGQEVLGVDAYHEKSVDVTGDLVLLDVKSCGRPHVRLNAEGKISAKFAGRLLNG